MKPLPGPIVPGVDSDLGQSTGRTAVRGIRWVLWLNVVTLPMSFLTNLVLGRRSVEALGMYGAIQIAISGFQTFLIFGGNAVFTRFVPSLPRERRLPFLASYTAMVLGFVSAVWLSAWLVAPGFLASLLARFGAPPIGLVYFVAVTVVFWAFGSHFLYGMEQAPQAASALKLVVVFYFLFSLVCLTPLGGGWLASPARPLWLATAVAYGAAATLAVTLVAALPVSLTPRTLGWFLPRGFWPVVFYTHLGTVVEFVYFSLAPSVVLLWLDVAALGRLTAALRWVTLVALLPGMLVSVVSPGLAKLEASGLRDDALRQARSAIRASELAVVPAVLGLVLFAPELMSVFGPDYRKHSSVLMLSALSALAGPLVFLGSGLAIAFGELRGYLVGSLVYVVSSLGLSFLLIPRFGLNGAATAIALSSATQCAAVAVVVRRLGLRPSRTTVLGFLFGPLALALAWALSPQWPVAAVICCVLIVGFAWSAGVSIHELRRLAGRALGLAP